MREFITSAEVDAVLADAIEDGKTLEDMLAGRKWIVCERCGHWEDLRVDGPPMSVVVEVGQLTTGAAEANATKVRVKLVHPECGPSMAVLGGIDKKGFALEDMLVYLPLIRGMPVLLFAPAILEFGEVWTKHCLAMGFSASAATTARNMRPLPGWSVRVNGREVALIAPKPQESITFEMEADTQWRAAVRARGTCLVVTGALNLADFDVAQTVEMLDSGALAAALVVVEFAGEVAS